MYCVFSSMTALSIWRNSGYTGKPSMTRTTHQPTGPHRVLQGPQVTLAFPLPATPVPLYPFMLFMGSAFFWVLILLVFRFSPFLTSQQFLRPLPLFCPTLSQSAANTRPPNLCPTPTPKFLQQSPCTTSPFRGASESFFPIICDNNVLLNFAFPQHLAQGFSPSWHWGTFVEYSLNEFWMQ